MQRYEYKVVLAPARGDKARGLKGTGERFAHSMTRLMNEMAADGWEYQRADTLPCEERSGLTGRVTTYQNLLTFRRLVAEAAVGELSREVQIANAPTAVPVQDKPAQVAALATPASGPRITGPANRVRAIMSQMRAPGEKPAGALSVRAPLGEAPRIEGTASEAPRPAPASAAPLGAAGRPGDGHS